MPNEKASRQQPKMREAEMPPELTLVAAAPAWQKPKPAFPIDDEIERWIKEGRLRDGFQNNPYVVARFSLVGAVKLAENAEKSRRSNSKVVDRRAASAVKHRLKSYAAALANAKVLEAETAKWQSGKPRQVEDAIAAWHARMKEWVKQGREIEKQIEALSIGGWIDDVEPPAARSWARVHYKASNAIRARTEKRVREAKGDFDAALVRFRSAVDVMAAAFSELGAETPKLTGKYDAFFVVFINELADLVEQLTGGSPDPNGQAFERFIIAAHKTLTKGNAKHHLPHLSAETWDSDRAMKRHASIKDGPHGPKTKHSPWNSKIRNALSRRDDQIRALRSGNV